MPLALAVRRAGRMPQPREVGGQSQDASALLLVEHRPIGVPLPSVLFLRVGQRTQPAVPLGFQLVGD
jgi:hypothetical protein